MTKGQYDGEYSQIGGGGGGGTRNTQLFSKNMWQNTALFPQVW